jgi:hypothetical protein
MRLRCLVISLAFLGVSASGSWGQSQEPPRQDSERTKQQPKDENQPSAQPSPLIKNIISEQAEKKNSPAEHKTTEYWYGSWNLSDKIAVIASVVAFLQFLALIATVRVMRQTARSQLRAYVMVDIARIDDLKVGGKLKAHLTFKNSGQTPARELTHWCAMGFDEFPLSGTIKTPDGDDPPPRPLAPQGVLHTWADEKRTLNQETMDALAGGSHAVYVIGQIRYIDAFGVKRETDFLMFAGGPVGVGGELASYRTGNRIT